MIPSKFKRLVPLVITLVSLLLATSAVSAQKSDNRSLQWTRWDVAITNIVTASNSFDVTETHVLTINRGPYRFGFREIPLDRLVSIDNVTVYDNGSLLQEECSQSAGTFCLSKTSDNFLRIEYYFATSADSGDKHTIKFVYTVNGALRSFKDGDELAWKALADDRPFPVLASRVTIQMPSGVNPIQFGSDPKNWESSNENGLLTFRSPSGSLGKQDNVEVGVKYPHDANMAMPSWQNYEFSTKPLINLILVAVTALVAIVGSLFMFIYYSRHGRDPQVAVVPEYLTEPPSEIPPGVVGTLVDESADMQDILATVVDLARRGYIVIEQTKESHLGGLISDTEFVFHLQTSTTGGELLPYERSLISGIFPGSAKETTLSSLKNRFYTAIPTIKSGLYKELVTNGFFPRSPETTRNMWMAIAVVIVVLGGGAAYGLYQIKNGLWMFLPAGALVIPGLLTFVLASYMPAKTAKGAQEAAKWKAFRNYLKNIKKYADVSKATDQFEKYIGYATAFGLNQQWTSEFVGVLNTFPTWYYPTYLGGPWNGGYGYYRQHGRYYGNYGGSGSSLDLGAMNRGGQGMGLNDFDKSLSQGLNAMNTGLTTMLNQAASTFTSQPSSSGKGSSFGGGGFSGGGSSGGGRAGFG